ncbi:MAG: hypothetical protein L6R28_03285 [Planctomycetes bacterium]|nr:hypothetical protein [Planctomycetota bacterium]
MNRSMKTFSGMALAAGLLFAAPANAEDAGSGKPEPQNVDKMAVELLNTTINLKVTDMRMLLAWSWAARLTDTNLPIVVWPQAGEKKVSLEFTDAPLAEVLRKVKEQTGAEHRFRDGKIHLLLHDEVAAFEKGEDPKPAAEHAEKKEADSGQPAPQKVGSEAELLMRKVTLEMVNTPLAEALGFLSTLSQVPTECDKGIAQKTVTLKLADATMAEAMKQIRESAGGEHRVVDGTIRIASPEQWKAIDAGTAKFATADGEAPAVQVAPNAQDRGNPRATAGSIIGGDGANVAASISVTESREYVINGKHYTEDDLKKELPDVWKSLQTPGEPGTIRPDAKVSINGKVLTAKEAKEQFPAMFEKLNFKIAE